ncbi:2-succinyl-5-enolpyruvyl-6-hydroxy-3-cyclohexene-1-carboxylate synthase, partial [Serratia marcescens]
AAMFQLGYARPENWSQLQQAVEQGWRRGGATLIELQVTPSAGAESLQYLVQQMAVQ